MGLRARNVLLSIVRSHFLTKMVFLQSSIIKIFYAHENSFFLDIFLSQLANKQLFLRTTLIYMSMYYVLQIYVYIYYMYNVYIYKCYVPMIFISMDECIIELSAFLHH